MVDHTTNIQNRIWILFIQVMEFICYYMFSTEHNIGMLVGEIAGKSKVFTRQG